MALSSCFVSDWLGPGLPFSCFPPTNTLDCVVKEEEAAELRERVQAAEERLQGPAEQLETVTRNIQQLEDKLVETEYGVRSDQFSSLTKHTNCIVTVLC